MNILRNYTIREYVPPFLFGIAIFTFIFIASKMVYLTNLVINKGVGVISVFKLLIFSLPSMLLLTIPMAVLLACLLSISRLSADNEMTAIKASGINITRVLVPVLAIGILVSMLMAFSYDRFLPYCNYRFVEQVYEIVHKKPVLELQERAFNNLGDIRIYINKISQKTNKLEELIISENKPGSSRFITAQEGIVIMHPGGSKVTLQLTNGTIHQTDETDKSRYQALNFNVHNITVKLPQADTFHREKGLDEMSNTELRKEIEIYRSTGTNINPLLVELYRRASLPFACLSFTLLGIPLGLKARRRSKSISFGVSVAVIFSYYIFLVGAETMGSRGSAPPLLTMWAPNILFSALGIYLLVKSVK